MYQLLIYFFIGISLSMDAFSLALVYGMNRPKLSKCYLISILVGVFHFIMPNLGVIIGRNFIRKYLVKSNILVGIIFLILAIQMLLSKNEEKKENITNILSMILFAFAVSIDSFSVGIALGIAKENIILASIMFSIISSTFTLIGLLLANKITEKYNKNAIYIGIFIP